MNMFQTNSSDHLKTINLPVNFLITKSVFISSYFVTEKFGLAYLFNDILLYLVNGDR